MLLRVALIAAICFGGAVQAASARAERDQARTEGPVAPAPRHDGLLRVTEVIGSAVLSPQGRQIGAIEDMVVDLRTGDVPYATVVFDPLFLPRDRLCAVPTRRLRPTAGGKVILDAPKLLLAQSSIERSRWTKDYFNRAGRLARVDRRWGVPVRHRAEGLVRASSMVGSALRSSQTGETIGALEELVIDLRLDRVRYAVVNFDRAWLGSDKRAAVRIEALHRRRGSDDLVANIDHARANGMRAATGTPAHIR